VVGIVFVGGVLGVGQTVMAGELRNVPFFLLITSLAGLFLFYNYTRWRQRLVVYANGFVWTRVVRKPLTLLWRDVSRVDVSRHHSRQSFHTKGVHVEVTLTLKDGKRVVVTNDMDGIEAVASHAGAPQAAVGASPTSSPWGAAV
jgi:hypothetical protein